MKNPSREMDPMWPLMDRAINEMNPDLLAQALQSERRHPVLDHPIRRIDQMQARRRDFTAHALALWHFFGLVGGSRQPDALAADAYDAIDRAAQVCRLLMQAKAKAFTASIGTGLEDDHTFVSTMFVQCDWKPAAEDVVAQLFDGYVANGDIDVDAYLNTDHSIIGGLLPVDAAIKLGNSSAAAACIRNRCDMRGIAIDRLGRAIDLIDYVRAESRANAMEVSASVTQALMVRQLGEAEPAPQCGRNAPARRRASV